MLALTRLEHRLRPAMAHLLSAKAFSDLYSRSRKGYLERLSRSLPEIVDGHTHPVEVMGLKFRNDLGNAAGLDKDGALLELNWRLGAGFAVVGTVLDAPHTGNLVRSFGKDVNPWTPLPFSGSALNSLGLPSLGLEPALDNIKAFRQRVAAKDFPIGVSIMGHPAQDGQKKLDGILRCVEKSLEVADFIEINESCPNVKHQSGDGLATRLEAVARVKKGCPKPILVKLGSMADADITVQMIAASGLDGLILVNTQRDYAALEAKLDPRDLKLFRWYTSQRQGGLSGAAIRDISFEAISRARAAADKLGDKNFTLIHVGGIMNRDDMEKSRKLAPLREWYTGLMDALGANPASTVYPMMTKG